MKTEHTPGPWKAIEPVTPVGYSTHEIQFGNDGECVAEIVHGSANAKLIADSPLMLAYIIKKAEEGCEEAKNIVQRHAH